MMNRVRALRTELGWSQGELGAALSVSRQTVNAIEAGRYDPSLPLAFRIAAVFGLRIEEIFAGSAGGDVQSPPDPPSPRAATKASP
jgi:putative transcriptional regulator